MKQYIMSQLNSLKSVKTQEFITKITKCKHKALGVTVPNIKLLAKDICKKDYRAFLDNPQLEYYEEYMLYGFVICYAKMDNQLKYDYLDKYVTMVADWSECDSIISCAKFLAKDVEKTFLYAQKYISNNISDNTQEFVIRCGVNMLMDYCIGDKYINQVLDIYIHQFALSDCSLYYINMAVAWGLSVCFVKYYDLTYKEFSKFYRDSFIFNKSISKCTESFRLTKEQKEAIKNIKTKNLT